MTRRVHDVYFGVAVADGRVLGQNGDAPLTLQIVGVHDAIHGLLIFPIYTALLEHFVHQRGLAVVDVGNDGNVSQLIVLQW